MRRAFTLLLCSVLASPVAAQDGQDEVLTAGFPEVAQEVSETTETTAPTDDRETYAVQITEYRADSAMDPKLTASEVVERLLNPGDDQSVQHVETVRMTVLSGSESMVQFGRSATVTTGSMTDQRGTFRRQTNSLEIGTVARVMAEPQSGKVLLVLEFEASRLVGEGTADSPPDVTRTQIRSSYLVEPGTPVLIGSTTAGETTYVILTLNY